MYQKGIVIAALFLLIAAGVFAAPLVTVDKNVTICNKTTCANSTTVQQGIRNLDPDLTQGIRSITVHDLPAQNVRGQLVRSQYTPDGKVHIYARGLNTSAYRAEVGTIIGYYFDMNKAWEQQFIQQEMMRKYPLPSWAPRPGQCDMGVRMTNSMGDVVCVRQRGRGSA